MRNFILSVFLICLVSFNLSTQEKKAPDFTLKDINEKIIKLSDYKGKVVILNFWATWCPPCRAEIPDFIKFYNSYKDKGIVIIGVAVSSKLDDIKNMVKEKNITYPVCQSDGKIESLYGGIRAVPTTFIIDRNGNIREKKVGALTEKELIDITKDLL
ncbi:MAG: TlpA disulfide reductase family protein [Candidatus Ratteibacteria bacterium]